MAGGILALVLSISLSGCSSGQSTLSRVLSVLRTDSAPLSEETQKQLDRFKTVYRAYSSQPDKMDRLDYFDFAFRRVRAGYVRKIPDATLIDAAIKGVRETKAKPGTLAPKALVEAALTSMMASLDPHSVYLNADDFHETFVKTRGEFGGLGIQITMEKDLVKVISPIEDTPAALAGIKAGDLITHVDGEPIKGKTISQAVKRMRGRPGTGITLTIRRPGRSDFPVRIIRAVIKVKAVRWRIEGDIGYVRVARFTEKMESGIENAMSDIHAKLGSRLAGVVLDLRNNPGGLLDQSLILADSFLEKGEIVSVRGRNRGHDRSHMAQAGDLANGAPMVVLINAGSASASEIVASALQSHHRALLMGTRSFGKGSVQNILPMPVEGGLKLTTSLYYAPSGHTIQARGVLPDIVIYPAKESKDRHETDLPGAIPAVGKDSGNSVQRPRVPENSCPAIGKKKDRELGCALALLHAGSAKNFLAQMSQQRPQT
ncbi:MAG: S41 family peptidase [Rhodospirillales bacterium]|nr:S41 family peptidase [Alphaproteobacteria bacterium]MBL6947398.1 S41 family peptidase [Rhodospirillales bacterium]